MTSIISTLVGQTLLAATYDAATFEAVFVFTAEVSLRVAAPWRIVVENEVRLGHDDHQQRFGLPSPLDARERLAALMVNRNVASATVKPLGDLVVEMTGGPRLEVFNGSGGYEGWIFNGPKGCYLVAQGGGTVVEGVSRPARHLKCP